ncbi:MAG: adenylyl-sulfate kinase [Bacteroidales bacterium]|nr:adenylyl-sulfate kinase [Bacteroidales bacterium]MDD3892761.1 adenylyl-sulfate kinase [Bacteroidales bacterium]
MHIVKPSVIWFTGLSSAGKTTIAQLLYKTLQKHGIPVVTIDGDEFRQSLSADLGFSIAHRQENIRRAAQMARLVVQSDVTVICSFISPTIQIREQARSIIGSSRFIEVYISTPLDICMQRDIKGLYQKASDGLIKNLTGIDSPYEPPLNPDCTINTTGETPEESARQLFNCITQKFC